jgi:hypothetical protein
MSHPLPVFVESPDQFSRSIIYVSWIAFPIPHEQIVATKSEVVNCCVTDAYVRATRSCRGVHRGPPIRRAQRNRDGGRIGAHMTHGWVPFAGNARLRIPSETRRGVPRGLLDTVTGRGSQHRPGPLPSREE